jgi:ribonucleoside-diphosphate reductase alpha chain
MKVLNSANESTGAVHWMKFEDSIGYYVGQAGRVPAMLFSLSIDHPDVEEFITVKKDFTKIQNANISVQITEKFYKAVEQDKEWELRFEIPAVTKGDKVYVDIHSASSDCTHEKSTGRYYKLATHNRKREVVSKKVSARKLLELIAKNMATNAEPGIQNIDIARKYSNSDAVYDPNGDYDSRVLSTNACCVTGYTLVQTNKGWVSIKDIHDRMKSGERFLAMSYNLESGSYEMKSIVNSWQQRNDRTITLNLEENGIKYEVECSSDHPILTRNRGYVRADSLTSEDDIVIYS